MALKRGSCKMIKRIFFGATLGGFVGYLYYYFIGCYSGTCVITSNPLNSIIYGAILGGLLIELVSDIKISIVKGYSSYKNTIFDKIAPFYGLFYGYQKKKYGQIIDSMKVNFDLNQFESILDVGCGTGALCQVMSDRGITVAGVDPSDKMLYVAKKKNKDHLIKFYTNDPVEGLPFEDSSFDISIASYVAHGLQKKERELMYAEMKRISDKFVIIYDYNENRSVLTDLVERAEGGDYFAFIQNVNDELRDYFEAVEVINVGKRGAWYLCKVIK